MGLATGCTDNRALVPDSGSARIQYRTPGSFNEEPEEVETAIYDRRLTNVTCGNFPLDLSGAYDRRVQDGPNGNIVFGGLPAGDWVAVSIGSINNSIKVGSGCQTFRVNNNRATVVSYDLNNNIDVGVTGIYRPNPAVRFDGPLGDGVQVFLIAALSVGCPGLQGILNSGTAIIDIVDGACQAAVTTVQFFQDIELDVTWEILSTNRNVRGQILLDRINGRPLSSNCRFLIREQFYGTLIGTEVEGVEETELTIPSREFLQCALHEGIYQYNAASEVESLILQVVELLIASNATVVIDDLVLTNADGNNVAANLEAEVTVTLEGLGASLFGEEAYEEEVNATRISGL